VIRAVVVAMVGLGMIVGTAPEALARSKPLRSWLRRPSIRSQVPVATNTVWPRNALRGLPIHKVDLRLTKRVKAGGVNLDLLAEVFNAFNWNNYGNYNTQLDSASFGQPVASSGNAYVARSGQLGFRVEF